MERRQKDSCIGFETACKLEQLHPNLKHKCILDFSSFYDKALNYISKRYDLSEENFHARIAKLSLKDGLTFAEFGAAVKCCNIKNLDMDELYEEFDSIEQVLELPEFQSLSTEQRYLQQLKVTEIPSKLSEKFSLFLFLILSNNAHSERTFSLMKTA